jgi:hypothetical protein
MVVNGSVSRWVKRQPGSARVESQAMTGSSTTTGEKPLPPSYLVWLLSISRWAGSSVPKYKMMLAWVRRPSSMKSISRMGVTASQTSVRS